MNLRPCRDCGEMMDPSSRGCVHCARNLEAERMIARRLAGGGLLILGALLGLLLYTQLA